MEQVSNMSNSDENLATKRCPFCGEKILAIAIKCRYCGEMLQNSPIPPQNPQHMQAPASPQAPQHMQAQAPPQTPQYMQAPAPPQAPQYMQVPTPPQAPFPSAYPPQMQWMPHPEQLQRVCPNYTPKSFKILSVCVSLGLLLGFISTLVTFGVWVTLENIPTGHIEKTYYVKLSDDEPRLISYSKYRSRAGYKIVSYDEYCQAPADERDIDYEWQSNYIHREWEFAFLISLIVSAVIGLINAIPFLMFYYRCWNIIQDGYARTTPGKAVGFMFIPLFNLIWQFTFYHGLAADMNSYMKRHNIFVKRCSQGLPLTICILNLIFPYIVPFLLIFNVVSLTRTAVAIQSAKNPQPIPSGNKI